MIISLEKSCEDVLSKTNGVYSVLCVTDAMKVYDALRTKNNNNCEQPFAFVKELIRFFPSVRLSVIEGLAEAAQNKTFSEMPRLRKQGSEKRVLLVNTSPV